MKNLPIICASALIVSAFGVSAFGATSALAGDWSYAVTPYFWMAGADGDVKPFTSFPSTHTDMSFGDVLDDLQLGGAAVFEGSNGHWGFITDFSYVDTDTGEKAVSSDTDYDVAALETKSTWFSAAATLRVYDESNARVDVLAGLRSNWIDNSVRLVNKDDGSRLNGSHDENWVDPIIGARVVAPLSNHWSFTGYGDIGGFGVGSQFTYEAYAAVNYNFSRTMSVLLGYRYLSVDYDENGFVYDVAQHGPMIGAQFRF